MNGVVLVLCTVLPAALVLLAAVVILQRQSGAVERILKQELALEAKRQTLPVRLQAYERMTLLMERISPEALLMRTSPGEANSTQYKQVLLEAISAEWNHNLSQQIYLSQDMWNAIRTARGQVVELITACAEHVNPDAPASELTRTILAALIELDTHPTSLALAMLRAEAFQLF